MARSQSRDTAAKPSRIVRPFTPEEDARLLGMHDARYTHTEMSQMLDRDRSSITSRLIRLGRITKGARADMVLGTEQRQLASIERKCLRCGHPFMSDGPHNRMCVPCKA